MAKILISPGKYVQGAGEMKKLYDYAKVYGKKALVLITASGYLFDWNLPSIDLGGEGWQWSENGDSFDF